MKGVFMGGGISSIKGQGQITRGEREKIFLSNRPKKCSTSVLFRIHNGGKNAIWCQRVVTKEEKRKRCIFLSYSSLTWCVAAQMEERDTLTRRKDVEKPTDKAHLSGRQG